MTAGVLKHNFPQRLVNLKQVDKVGNRLSPATVFGRVDGINILSVGDTADNG